MGSFVILGTDADGTERHLLGLMHADVNTPEEALAYFAASQYATTAYTGIHAITTEEENRRSWWSDFGKLKPLEQELVRVFYPRIDEPGRDMATVKRPDQLLAGAQRKVVALGLHEPCSRCMGSGHYSRCDEYGTTCFKCGTQPGRPGSGLQTVRLTREVLGEVKARKAAQEVR